MTTVAKPNSRRLKIDLRLERFRLPPVQGVLVIGRKAPIGPNAMIKAIDEMIPNAFEKVEVKHPTIEAVIVRKSLLRAMPEDKLTKLLLREADAIMDDTDTVHASVDFEVTVTEEIDL